MASAGEQRFRGYAVLISNEEFPFMNLAEPTHEDPTRKGADKDDTNLQYIFSTKLGFQLLDKRTYTNVNKEPSNSNVSKEHWIHDNRPQNKRRPRQRRGCHSENEKCPCSGHDSLQQNERCPCPCISCKIQTTDHSESEGFVLAISTHGVQVDRKQEIVFSDDCRAERVKLSDIIETLSDDNCKTLKGKPRIILLQLCRSDPDVPKDKQDDVWHDKEHDNPVDHSLKNLTIKESETSGTPATNNGTGEPKQTADRDVEGVEANDPEKDNFYDKQDDVWHDKEHDNPVDHSLKNLTIKESETSGTPATNNGTGEPKQTADRDVEGVEANDPEKDKFYDKQDDVWHDKEHDNPVDHSLKNLTIEESETSGTPATNNGTGEPKQTADRDVEGVEANDPEKDNFYDKQDDVWHDKEHDNPVDHSLKNLTIKESETSGTPATNNGTGEPKQTADRDVEGVEANDPEKDNFYDKQDDVCHDKEHDNPVDHSLKNLTIEESETSGTPATNNGTGEPREIADTNVEGAEANDPETDYFYGTEEALRNLPPDFLIIFPTVSGKKTWHNFEYGSWLIQELREVVENFKFEQTPDMNFLTVLTKTAENVALKKESKEGYKCAVCIVHRLLRPIIFRDIRDTSQEQPTLVKDRPAL